ncbi:IS4 family transposase [Streptomyces sp. NPDC020817]|uniref:IS4 family transposase n=1 Tax=Streptomyces sp. NPDC020817 TaxID=3365095 RepID=UPI003799A5C1
MHSNASHHSNRASLREVRHAYKSEWNSATTVNASRRTSCSTSPTIPASVQCCRSAQHRPAGSHTAGELGKHRTSAGERVRIGILTKVFTAELVDAAIAKHDRAEQRCRLLPARLVVYFVLVLCLFARESYEEVLRVLTSGLPGSRTLAGVNRSSLCRARSGLGEDVMETLFRLVAGPLATQDTPGAWWRGLRLLALDGTRFDLPDSASNGDTFDGPSTGGIPFGFPRVRAAVLAEIGTHGVLDARLGGYRDGERSLAYPLAASTGPDDLVIADRGFWSVEFAHAFTATGANLLVRLQSNHLGTAQEELTDGSYVSMMRPGKEVRLRASREGRTLPRQTTYRVITFTKDDKTAYLGTTLLDREQHPASELIALYQQRWEIELAFDEIKNHLGPSGPIRSRTPEGVRQELWAYLAVHRAIRQFAHAAAIARPSVDAYGVSYLKCVRIIRRSVPSQAGATTARLTRTLAEAAQEARSRMLPARRNRNWPPRDQETQPMARATDSRWPGHSRARPLDPQPDQEAEDQQRSRETPAQDGTGPGTALKQLHWPAKAPGTTGRSHGHAPLRESRRQRAAPGARRSPYLEPYDSWYCLMASDHSPVATTQTTPEGRSVAARRTATVTGAERLAGTRRETARARAVARPGPLPPEEHGVRQGEHRVPGV